MRILADMLVEIVSCAVAMRVEVLRLLLSAACVAHGCGWVAVALSVQRGAGLDVLQYHARFVPGLSRGMRAALCMEDA